jgi:uncharacterized membrane protein YhhN
MSAAAWVVVCALCVAALLAAEYRAWRPGVWLAKPLAACCFIGLALQQGALDSSYGICVLAALVACWWGDVLLIPNDAPRSFLAGLVCFLTGHLGFVVAFLVRGVSPAATLVAAPLIGLGGFAILRWLRPHVPKDMQIPVLAYVVVIGSMLALAIGTVSQTWSTFEILGATMFVVSDLAVARDRFVSADFWNGAWGLPLYFGGQLLLAASVAGAAA